MFFPPLETASLKILYSSGSLSTTPQNICKEWQWPAAPGQLRGVTFSHSRPTKHHHDRIRTGWRLIFCRLISFTRLSLLLHSAECIDIWIYDTTLLSANPLPLNTILYFSKCLYLWRARVGVYCASSYRYYFSRIPEFRKIIFMISNLWARKVLVGFDQHPTIDQLITVTRLYLIFATHKTMWNELNEYDVRECRESYNINIII